MKTVINLDLVVADSVARPLLQSFKQFNGTYGCGFACITNRWYAREWERIQSTWNYTTTASHCSLRQMQRNVVQMCLAWRVYHHSTKFQSSILSVASTQNIYIYIYIYMHSVFLGVVRQFVNLWFDSSSHGKQYSMRAAVDSIIVKIKPPSEIKQLPRSLKVRRYWKAPEWRAFLLFYSIISMKLVMSTALYRLTAGIFCI